MSKQTREVLSETLTALGIILGISLVVSGLFYGGFLTFSWEKARLLLGLILAGAYDAFYMIHLAHTMERAMDLDAKGASSYAVRGFSIRIAVLILLVLACYFSGVADVLAIALGVLMLKLALYLRPVIHRIRCGKEPDYDESLAHLRIEDPEDEDDEDDVYASADADPKQDPAAGETKGAEVFDNHDEKE
ncbi:MAG: ATP synthase subunit I [Lachnospiraceae bacterium]|nr:ATP synthase subunit I [Lachnospiraceae bacterium]